MTSQYLPFAPKFGGVAAQREHTCSEPIFTHDIVKLAPQEILRGGLENDAVRTPIHAPMEGVQSNGIDCIIRILFCCCQNFVTPCPLGTSG